MDAYPERWVKKGEGEERKVFQAEETTGMEPYRVTKPCGFQELRANPKRIVEEWERHRVRWGWRNGQASDYAAATGGGENLVLYY